jgi:hypothetical protein
MIQCTRHVSGKTFPMYAQSPKIGSPNKHNLVLWSWNNLSNYNLTLNIGQILWIWFFHFSFIFGGMPINRRRLPESNSPHILYGRRLKVCHPPFPFLYNIVFHMLQLCVRKILTYNGAKINCYTDFIAFSDLLVYNIGCLVMLNFPFGYFLIISFD